MLIFRFDVCQVRRNWVVAIILRLSFRILRPSFSTSKIFLCPSYLKMLSCPRCSLITSPFHGDVIILVKSDAPLMESKMAKLPGLVTCGKLTQKVTSGSSWCRHEHSLQFQLFFFRKTLLTSNGDVLITVSSSGNGSAWLVGVDEGWVTRCIVQTHSRTSEGLQATYHEYFRPVWRFSYESKLSCFYPSALGVSVMFCHCMLKIRFIFSKTLE